MTLPNEEIEYKARWYFGGVASAAAVLITHPLDTLKVLLQTQTEKKSIVEHSKKLIRDNGVIGFYNGVSASVARQLTYSMARFALYQRGKEYINTESLVEKVFLAGLGGAVGGFIGTPTDVVNVRMQNDVKLPFDKRRNYKHVFDGLYQVYRREGIGGWFSGGSTTSIRGGVMTIGQLAFYDQVKGLLLRTKYFKDDVPTHLTASLCAGIISTFLTQPFDVVKTRVMNSKPGENGILDVIRFTSKAGPLGFFTGFVPAFIRIAPQTVFIFIFFEQLRLNFGIPIVKRKEKDK